MRYKLIARNIITNEVITLDEVRGLHGISELFENIVFDDNDNVEEWVFEVHPIL